MSTFFEKLTNSHSSDEEENMEEAEEERPLSKKERLAKPTKLRVDTERDLDEEPEEPETQSEDEGELTVDIYDKGDSIFIQSTVAGVKPEDLDVSISSDAVTIRGKREQQDEVKEDNYYYKELFWGSFSRSVILPEEIDDDKAEASLKHGLLTIRLPKKKKGTVQKLKVKFN